MDRFRSSLVGLGYPETGGVVNKIVASPTNIGYLGDSKFYGASLIHPFHVGGHSPIPSPSDRPPFQLYVAAT